MPSAARIYEATAERARFFIDVIGYEPENIAVLTNDKGTADKAVAALSTQALNAVPIKDHDFAFDLPGVVRVSTLHSSKGLDFPVVLLALPKQPFVGNAHAPEVVLILDTAAAGDILSSCDTLFGDDDDNNPYVLSSIDGGSNDENRIQVRHVEAGATQGNWQQYSTDGATGNGRFRVGLPLDLRARLRCWCKLTNAKHPLGRVR